MRIAFLGPTWTDDLGIFDRIARKRNSQPPLGILYLASVAERRGHTVRIIDAAAEGADLPTQIEMLRYGGFDVIGFTATSPIFHKAVAVAEELKERGSRARLLIGGEHMNIFRQEAFPEVFDYGFFGEGDASFNRFLEIIESGSSDFRSMTGFLYREGGEIIETPPAEHCLNLDDLPFPAMHLLRKDAYQITFVQHRKRAFLPIMASRGCPFKCVYCSEPLTNPCVRFRSPANIVDEMERWLTDLGVSHFFFQDSNLTLNRPMIEAVCREILKRRLKLTFEGWTRANLVDRDLLRLLHRSGLIRISYGIESGDTEVLRIIRKEVSPNDMMRAFRLTEEEGIEPACSVMLGLPGDTRASVMRTIEFVRNIPQMLYTNFSIANPYPGTEMLRWATEGRYGMRLRMTDFSEYRRYDNSPVSVNDLSKVDLVRLQKTGLIRMHLTLKRIYAAQKMLGFTECLLIMLKFLTELKSIRRPRDDTDAYAAVKKIIRNA